MSSNQDKLAEFFGKFYSDSDNEESDEDRLRRQLKEKDDSIKKLEKQMRSKSRENQTLHQRVTELLGENKSMHKIIDELNQKLAVYDAVKKKEEKRAIKTAKRVGPKIDENNPDDEIHHATRFPSRPTKRVSSDEYDDNHKRQHMIDKMNNLTLHDRGSRSTRETPK
uniref:Uncharacterized protein n=1 Tax=Panagrolaimus sp. ES5 TaxID=591445 RepID=A0AC34G488_9BILA